MPQSRSILKAYKGPAILAAAAVTLIAALAIPKATEARQPKPEPFEIKSTWTAEVKRSEVPVGKDIAVGETLLVLTDPALEKEISQLEGELKIAMLGTKEAVVDAGSMMGMIGTLPKVVWQTVEEPTISGAIEKPIPAVKSESPQVGPLAKEMDGLSAKLNKTDSDMRSKETELQEATSAVSIADGDLETAQRAQSAAVMLVEHSQKLYDMGAIPKKRLDAATAENEQSAQALASAKTNADAAKERQASLEKELADLKAEFGKLESQVGELKSKLDKAKASPVVTQPIPEQKPQATPKRVRKVVYGTASAQESLAPVQVKLVDSETPGEEQKIEDLRAKLVALKLKREDLKIKATQAGRVVWIAEAGSKVEPGAKIVTIQP